MEVVNQNHLLLVKRIRHAYTCKSVGLGCGLILVTESQKRKIWCLRVYYCAPELTALLQDVLDQVLISEPEYGRRLSRSLPIGK
jgi:hypothetical protein